MLSMATPAKATPQTEEMSTNASDTRKLVFLPDPGLLVPKLAQPVSGTSGGNPFVRTAVRPEAGPGFSGRWSGSRWVGPRAFRQWRRRLARA